MVPPRVKMTPTMSNKQKLPTTRKKVDPVSRFHNMQNEWSKNTFLKNKGQQGRKLELDRFNKWRQLVDEDNKKSRKKASLPHLLAD